MSVSFRESRLPLSPSLSFGCLEVRPSNTRLVQPNLPSLAWKTTYSASGLRTPPVDDMSTTYQPAVAAYDGHGLHQCSSMGGSRSTVVPDSRQAQYYQPHAQHSQQLQPSARSQQPPHLQTQPALASSSDTYYASAPSTSQTVHSQHSTRPSTPGSEAGHSTRSTGKPSRRDSKSLVYHSMRIPKMISSNGGSLPDFAAQVSVPSTLNLETQN